MGQVQVCGSSLDAVPEDSGNAQTRSIGNQNATTPTDDSSKASVSLMCAEQNNAYAFQPGVGVHQLTRAATGPQPRMRLVPSHAFNLYRIPASDERRLAWATAIAKSRHGCGEMFTDTTIR